MEQINFEGAQQEGGANEKLKILQEERVLAEGELVSIGEKLRYEENPDEVKKLEERKEELELAIPAIDKQIEKAKQSPFEENNDGDDGMKTAA